MTDSSLPPRDPGGFCPPTSAVWMRGIRGPVFVCRVFGERIVRLGSTVGSPRELCKLLSLGPLPETLIEWVWGAALALGLPKAPPRDCNGPSRLRTCPRTPDPPPLSPPPQSKETTLTWRKSFLPRGGP